MANVFRSKEVYKHLKHDLHDRNEIVAVQGVYVSGEYRPPYYNNPTIRIYEISSNPAKVDDFREAVRSSDEDACVKVIDFGAQILIPTITNYTTASAEAGEDGCVKVIDFGVQPLSPTLDWYTSDSVSAGEDGCVKVIDFGVSIISIPQPTVYTTNRGESTPEPTLRLTSFTSELATVTNYTP
jgi:predicted choloylglycine hydrolase